MLEGDETIDITHYQLVGEVMCSRKRDSDLMMESLLGRLSRKLWELSSLDLGRRSIFRPFWQLHCE